MHYGNLGVVVVLKYSFSIARLILKQLIQLKLYAKLDFFAT